MSQFTGLDFDPRFEDPNALQRLSRRGFFGRLLGGAAATALSWGGTASADPTRILTPLTEVPDSDNEHLWECVAGQFLLRKGLTYLNTGTVGPSPGPVHQAEIDALTGFKTDPTNFDRFVFTRNFRDAMRHKIAAFMGCKPTEVAYTSNTTEGMVFGTFGPDLQQGDEIIFTNHDHSGGAYPVLLRAARQNLTTKVIDLSARKYHPPKDPQMLIDAFEQAISPRTKLLCFCHINYTDGCILPVKEICTMARSKGVMTLVDGAQAPGMMKVDMHDLGCDMYASSLHKWVLATSGTGVFYVREGMIDRVWPTVYAGPVNNKNMYGDEISDTYKDNLKTAAKFERRGTLSTAARFSINAALDFHNALTSEGIEGRIRYMANRFRQGLEAMDGVTVNASSDPRLYCGLISFNLDGANTGAVNRMLWDRHGIRTRAISHKEINWDANRASLHIMATTRQVDYLLGAIEEIVKERTSYAG